MKKALLLTFAMAGIIQLQAQEFTPLQIISGYNADVIANGIGSSLLSTTSSFDNAAYALMSNDFQVFSGDTPPAYALPSSGLVSSATTAGLSYQLASYAGDNSLRLEQQLDFGSFVIANGAPSTTLYVLTATGSGTATLGGTIHFSDNSTQAIASGVIPDWFFSSALPVEISGFGRVSTNTDLIENPAGDPRLYQFQIAIAPENQSKTISSIDFSKDSAQEGVLNIFAVSAQTLGTCPPPNAIAITNVTNTTAWASWNVPAIEPANGYQYYLSSNNIAPTANTTGAINAPINTVSIEGLVSGTTYCMWVRSLCSGTDIGPWNNASCFTTGQIPTTSPDEIPTLYNLTVDTATTNSCPGILTVNVPAGYAITSVATSYQMQTALNGWMSEQRSLLVCNTTGIAETAVTSGIGGTGGTFSYARSNLDIANGATGTVEFELRAWRTFGGSDCNTDYNRVVGGSWTVTITVQEILATTQMYDKEWVVYPNPTSDLINVNAKQNIIALQLYNMLGQIVWQRKEHSTQNVQISTASLPQGQYLLKISSENGTQSTMIVKQ